MKVHFEKVSDWAKNIQNKMFEYKNIQVRHVHNFLNHRLSLFLCDDDFSLGWYRLIGNFLYRF